MRYWLPCVSSSVCPRRYPVPLKVWFPFAEEEAPFSKTSAPCLKHYKILHVWLLYNTNVRNIYSLADLNISPIRSPEGFPL